MTITQGEDVYRYRLSTIDTSWADAGSLNATRYTELSEDRQHRRRNEDAHETNGR